MSSAVSGEAAGERNVRRILSIDGGGIRCLIAIEVLALLERQLAERKADPSFRLCHHFDLVAGTSGGALIAGAIALGISMHEIREFVVANAKHMFRVAPWHLRLHSWYDKDELEHNLRDWFGADTTLGSPRLQTLVLMIMANWSTNSPWLISNHPGAPFNDRRLDDCNLDLHLWQIARASAAAPALYVPESIEFGRTHAYRFVFMDGGLTGFLNPAFKAFLYATTPAYGLNWSAATDRLTLLSIGSGDLRERRLHQDANDIGIVKALITATDDLLYCSVREQDVLCRTFGQCITGNSIDDELGDMIHVSQRAAPPLFEYHRINVALTQEGLASIECSGIDPVAVRPIDCVDQVAALTQIGACLAASQLSAFVAGA